MCGTTQVSGKVLEYLVILWYYLGKGKGVRVPSSIMVQPRLVERCWSTQLYCGTTQVSGKVLEYLVILRHDLGKGKVDRVPSSIVVQPRLVERCWSTQFYCNTTQVSGKVLEYLVLLWQNLGMGKVGRTYLVKVRWIRGKNLVDWKGVIWHVLGDGQRQIGPRKTILPLKWRHSLFDSIDKLPLILFRKTYGQIRRIWSSPSSHIRRNQGRRKSSALPSSIHVPPRGMKSLYTTGSTRASPIPMLHYDL